MVRVSRRSVSHWQMRKSLRRSLLIASKKVKNARPRLSRRLQRKTKSRSIRRLRLLSSSFQMLLPEWRSRLLLLLRPQLTVSPLYQVSTITLSQVFSRILLKSKVMCQSSLRIMTVWEKCFWLMTKKLRICSCRCLSLQCHLSMQALIWISLWWWSCLEQVYCHW